MKAIINGRRDAMQMYESLPEHDLEAEDAFPGHTFEDA